MLASDIRRAKGTINLAHTPSERGRVFHPSERGLLSPLDAVVLPNRGLAVALGEAGLRILDPRGLTLRTYHTPASERILADSGRRLIALHPRGDRVHLSGVDLETGRLDRWAETRLDRWCRSYDGATWYVAVGEPVLAIDVQDDFEALWSVGGLPSDPRQNRRDHRILARRLRHRWRRYGRLVGPREGTQCSARILPSAIGFDSHQADLNTHVHGRRGQRSLVRNTVRARCVRGPPGGHKLRAAVVAGVPGK